MIDFFEINTEKTQLLSKYKNYFNKLAIGSLSTTNVLKEHFQAIHVYIRVLEYYNAVDSDKVEIDYTLAEDIYFELQKSIYLLDTKYYV